MGKRCVSPDQLALLGDDGLVVSAPAAKPQVERHNPRKFPKTESEWDKWTKWYRQQKKLKKAPAPKPLLHGTRRGYKRGCRCVDCTEAQRAYYQQRYHVSLAKPLKPSKSPKLPKPPKFVELDCVVCGRRFDHKIKQGPTPLTCSPECWRKRQRERARSKPRSPRRVCPVQDRNGVTCGRRVASKLGLCVTHVYRLEHGLRLDAPIPAGPGGFGKRVKVGKPCSYGAAHERCRRLWGKPSLYPCVKCGETAQDWAYDGTDPTQLCGLGNTPRKGYSRTTVVYSQYPEFYMPLCKDCHRKRDVVWRRELAGQFAEFSEWKRASA